MSINSNDKSMGNNVFIAYFDFLGFKQFILYNDSNHLNTRTDHILRDIECALSKNRPAIDVGQPHSVYDISNSILNCINFSDTVIFWTRDAKIESLKELIEVATIFNSHENIHFFPIRGCITFGELSAKVGQATSKNQSYYRPNFVYGKGLIEAYELAESLDMAGTIVTSEVVDLLISNTEHQFIISNLLQFHVQYKTCVTEEYMLPFLNLDRVETSDRPAFNPVLLFNNISQSIRKNFIRDNKTIDMRTQAKIERTIEFLKFNVDSIRTNF